MNKNKIIIGLLSIPLIALSVYGASEGYLCGISAYYHTSKFLKAKEAYNKGDWRTQVQICHGLYEGGTRFYGFDNRHERGKNIVFNTI